MTVGAALAVIVVGVLIAVFLSPPSGSSSPPSASSA